jgi:serine/threonine protein kinase
LQYLHKNKVYHENIKLKNCIIATDGTIKLTNYGYTSILKKKRKNNNSSKGKPSVISDIRMLGEMMYELMTLKPYSSVRDMSAQGSQQTSTFLVTNDSNNLPIPSTVTQPLRKQTATQASSSSQTVGAHSLMPLKMGKVMQHGYLPPINMEEEATTHGSHMHGVGVGIGNVASTVMFPLSLPSYSCVSVVSSSNDLPAPLYSPISSIGKFREPAVASGVYPVPLLQKPLITIKRLPILPMTPLQPMQKQLVMQAIEGPYDQDLKEMVLNMINVV